MLRRLVVRKVFVETFVALVLARLSEGMIEWDLVH